MTAPTQILVLFDGECGLCHHWVRWSAPRDKSGRICFAPLSGPTANRILHRQGLLERRPDSLVVVERPDASNERLRFKSDAVISILARLSSPWPAAGKIASLAPRVLRDAVYGWIASRRLRWFGPADVCHLRKEAWASRILE